MMNKESKPAIPYDQKMTLWTNSLSAFVSKSDRADQPFNRGGVGAAAPSAREGQGQHYKKIVKALRARTKKGTTQARRAHQARAPLQRSTGRRAGARASRYGRAIAFPRPRGEESREKNDRENVRKCTQAAGPMQALHSPMHTNARTCTPNAPGMQAQVVIMMQLSKY